MVISLKKLLRLPVYTESEIKLGRIFDLEIDAAAQTVLRYLVRPNFLSAKYFLIAGAQVKEVKDDRVVVYDGAIKTETVSDAASE